MTGQIDPLRDYSNQAAVPDFQNYFDRWRSSSAEVRTAKLCFLDVPYGMGWRQTCDIFPASAANAPVLVFIHGGWWHFLDKSDHSFVAEPFLKNGASVVLLNYPLAPMVAIEDIVESVRKGVAWVRENIARFGGDPTRITVCGHSAGGHLTALIAQEDTNSERSVHKIVQACVSISGVYDLNPILATPHNKSIRMLQATAESATAMTKVNTIQCNMTIAIGEKETPGFRWQHNAFEERCDWAGKSLTAIVCDGDNHFSVVDGLSRCDSVLFQKTWASMVAAEPGRGASSRAPLCTIT
jgi:arylformamidase